MAYQQSELVNVLGLETVFIRGPDNYPISSQYVLYANGFGQGYWSNAVLPENLSSLSTSLGSTNIYIQQLSSGQAAVNQSTLSTTNELQSTVSTAYEYSISTTNALYIAVNSFYQSSVNYMTSTVLGVSTQSTFYAEINSLNTGLSSVYSTLSAAIIIQNASTYSSITQETVIKIGLAGQTQTNALNAYSNYVGVTYATKSSLSSVQGNLTTALVSTSDSLYSSILFVSSALSSFIYTINASTISTFGSIFSTLNVQSTQIAKLNALSTNLSSLSYGWTTSTVSTSQGIQDLNLAFSTNFLELQIVSTANNTSSLTASFQGFSTATVSTLSTVATVLSTTTGNLSSLAFEVHLLTTSSILSSIYISFVQLEQYYSTLYITTSTSVSTSIGGILYSTNLINISTADAFFNSNVSSVYASTVSVVVVSTMWYVSSLISTLYSSLYYNLNSTLQDTVYSSLTSTTFGYISTISPQITSNVTSTLVTQQVLLLSNTSSNAIMDFATYRNFYINVNNLQNGNTYKLSYLSNAISTLNYNRGVITIDISTVGIFYSTNSSLLVLDVNHYGYPTRINERYIPYVSNADYTMQYEYTILNQIIYTNLLGIYPRLNVTSVGISTFSSIYSVYSNGSAITNYVWRNTPIAVNWATYSFFPFSTVGAPYFNPQLQLTYNVGTSTIQTYGPFSFSQSTAVIQLPVISSATSTVIATSINAYVVGKPTTTVSSIFQTVLPTFNTLLLSSTRNITRISGNGLAGFSRTGSNLLSSFAYTVSTGTANSPNLNYSSLTYVLSNLLLGNTNLNFVGPSNTGVVPAVAIMTSTITTSNAFTTLIYSNCVATSLSSFAPSTNAQFMQLVGITNTIQGTFVRILPLTSSITTTFSL